ncbi:MAG: DUF4911 domain-containing protein [Smithellaceae bacterium]|jgi:hypothetical protein
MINKLFKLNHHNIALVQFIIEGYEGMATVSTIDPHTAIIKILIMPNFVSEINSLIDDLKNKYKITEIDPATWNPSTPAGVGKRRDLRGKSRRPLLRGINSTNKFQCALLFEI